LIAFVYVLMRKGIVMRGESYDDKRMWNLIIIKCERKIDNLISKNIKEILSNFWLIVKKKYT